MKILFAISNENVLNRIVDSYRTKYGEAVSFKNVFYFNAIIREIQKDKTYDRIVISEDLEPFSNNNYDIIDKFIIERLQEISTEAENSTGRKIEMIVICTDRRTKSSFVLSKMFEFGIYNALVGSDRRIDNVCDLIKNPRTEAEARQYYKLEGVANTPNTIDDVSEEEVQNILIHYQKLGRNEERYVDSFNNIAAQYTDNQLKIIIKCLPIHVKAVLEAECPKYQELVTYAGGETAQEKKQKERIQEQRKLEQIEQERKLKEKIERDKREAEKTIQKNMQASIPQKEVPRNPQPSRPVAPQPMNQSAAGTGIDILDNKHSQPRMTGNVIIPNNMNIRNERKIYSDDELSQIQSTPREGRMGNIEQTRIEQPVREEVAKPKTQITNEDLLAGFEDYTSSTQSASSETTLPGLDIQENDNDLTFDDILAAEPTTPKNEQTNTQDVSLPGFEEIDNLPGLDDIQLPQAPERPAQIQPEVVANTTTAEVQQPEQKRGRGRPRKYPVEPPKPKGKRGRPRKNPLPEEELNPVQSTIGQAQTLPGLDTLNKPQNLPGLDNLDETQDLPGLDNLNESQSLPGLDGINEVQNLPGLDDFNEVLNEPVMELPEEETLNNINRNVPINNFEEQNEAASTLPGFDGFEDINTIQSNGQANDMTLPGLDDYNDEDDDLLSSLPGLEDEKPLETTQSSASDEQFIGNIPETTPISTQKYEKQYESRPAEQINKYSPSEDRIESIRKLEENKIYSTGSLNTVLTKDKKVVAFVGAGKSGTSFLVNNLACLFSSLGIKTAILDMTKNKNSYYIYTNNEEELRNVAYTSIEKLESGVAEGIRVDRNLEVYTAMPNDGKDYSNAETILSTLVQNASLVLIDCDFDTNFGYFANAQEIYLVQSMDILTIQPLTGFLRDLKTKGILDQEKLRVVVNKELKVRNLSSKAVIGGMSFYNDPAMSYMTELFSKDKIKACTIPFDENVYSRYLEAMVNCVISINGYPKGFLNNLKILGNMVYPLLSRQTYTTKSSAEMNYGNNFSTEMNNTLNQMRNKY